MNRKKLLTKLFKYELLIFGNVQYNVIITFAHIFLTELIKNAIFFINCGLSSLKPKAVTFLLLLELEDGSQITNSRSVWQTYRVLNKH